MTRTRTTKTPGQRATEALQTATRVRDRAERKRDRLKAQLEAAQAEYETAAKRVKFLGSDPFLPKPAAGDPTPIRPRRVADSPPA